MAGKKKKKTGKKIPWWAVLLVLAAVFAVQYLGGKTEQQPAPTAQVQETPSGETLTVRFLDVGQGDSILLSCGDETMLIDGGPVEEGQFLVSRLNRLDVTELTYVVNTHPDEDHCGGLAAVLAKYE